MSVTQEEVLHALRVVKDPDLGKDIVALNFIKDLRIENDSVNFTIELTTPACPVKDQLKQQSEDAVMRLPGVSQVHTVVTSRVVGASVPQRETITGVRNIIAVGSGKGGVGKSTVAVNLAITLAQTGARVALLDADIYGPNVPQMMGAEGQPEASPSGKMQPIRTYGIDMISMAFFLPDKDTPVIWRGPMLTKLLTQFMYDVEWGELDYLVMDLPPGTGDVQLTTAQQLPLTGAVIVSTPQDVALLDAGKAIAMFQKLNVPILGVVENMSSFVCPHCGEPTNIFGHGGAKSTAARFNVPFLGEIPLTLQIRTGGDEGKPVAAVDPTSPATQAIREVASNVAAQVSILSYQQQQAALRGPASPIQLFRRRG